jgi:hypothetical protein
MRYANTLMRPAPEDPRSSRDPAIPTVNADSDAYFSADVETDGPIPGPYSMLSFAIVPAGQYDGLSFTAPVSYDDYFYAELRPISSEFQAAALAVNGLDRDRLRREGEDPAIAMTRAGAWIRSRAASQTPVLIAYPLSFDWSWLYWYFVRFCGASPFNHSRCFDLKTAVSLQTGLPIVKSGRDHLPASLRGSRPHTHDARDDAIEQAEIFARVMHWKVR